MSESENLRQILPRKPSQQDENWFVTLKVQLKAKQPVIWHVLLSKLFFVREETFTEKDQVALFTVYEKMVEKCAVDGNFKEKYGHELFFMRNIFKNLPAFVADQQSIEKMVEFLQQVLSHKRGWLSRDIYFGMKMQIYKVEMQYGEPKKVKPKNRIAVGYRDKGTAKDSAWDGSPSWQEVALDEMFQIVNLSKCITDKVEQWFQDLRVGEHYCWQNSKAYREPSLLVREMRG